jgi:hypothetical protein
MLASIAVLYVASTFGVGLLFGYAWFNDVPPAGIATTVAVIAQLLLVVLVAATCALTFGAFAALGLGEPSLRNAFVRSRRALIRDIVIAVPGFIVAVLAVMSVVLGPLVVGPLATRAVRKVVGPGVPPTRAFGRSIVLGLIPTAVSVVVWVLGAVAAWFPSPPTWLSAVFFVGLVGTSAFSMAWLAVSNVVLVRTHTSTSGQLHW